jgi:hypothetical protein
MRKSISGSTYPPDWPDIAKRCKEAAAWRCVRCGHLHDPARGYTLTVHHLDMDPSNCRWWNLAALCQRCHLQIQAKVVMERVWMFEHTPWFKPYVAGYYAFHAGLPDDEATVAQHIDALIALGQGKATREEIGL